jgi:Protein of unknown function (DUF4197)
MTLDAHTAATVNAARRLALLRTAALLGGTAALPGWALSELDATQGLRAALERGAGSAVSLLGRDGGFLNNPLVRIALPDWLAQGAQLLRTFGLGARIDALETAMNRAAEQAVPAAKPLLVNAVKSMSVRDAAQILRGGETSVTEFFAERTRTSMGEKFLPIVTATTEKVQLAQQYNAIASKAKAFGLVNDQQASVQQYVTGKALDGLYRMIGEEEKKIRQDPIGTGSKILQSVFGALKG